MFFLKDENQGNQVLEILKQYGYDQATYVRTDLWEGMNLGSRPTRYVHLQFDKKRGFHMSTTGTWVEGEAMKQVVQEAQMVTEICEKINHLLRHRSNEGGLL